ncbi:hypothetical protein GCM10009623_28310 [Nocardioides aestuarii]|uniref:TetR/AcrR family transcriptional regulator n=1 Tax=Nocardioides aestuarii TaxID=252231 RepID=A0ABW4TQF5_9ACTN
MTRMDVRGGALPSRPYDGTRRRVAAHERRQRIAAAAAELFLEHGWTGTTMGEVARRADVSTDLVSGAFGGKPGLLMAAFRHAGFGERANVREALASLRLDDEPDLDVRLEWVVDLACRVMPGMAPFLEVLRVAGDQDADLRVLVMVAEDSFSATAAEVVRLIAPGEAPPDAADEVYQLLLAETYLTFTRSRGWSDERYRAWLSRSLAAAVR